MDDAITIIHIPTHPSTLIFSFHANTRTSFPIILVKTLSSRYHTANKQELYPNIVFHCRFVIYAHVEHCSASKPTSKSLRSVVYEYLSTGPQLRDWVVSASNNDLEGAYVDTQSQLQKCFRF